MGRSRYKIYEPTHPHFITCTVLHWIPLFTRVESVQILLESLKHLQISDNLKIFARDYEYMSGLIEIEKMW